MIGMVARAQGAVLRALTKHGAEAIITRNGSGEYDPATGAVTSTSETYSAKAVLQPVTTWSAAGVPSRETIATMALEPRVDDILAIGGLTLRVTKVEAVSPTGEAIVYRATVEAG